MPKFKLTKVDQKFSKFLSNYDKKTKAQLLIASSGILVFLLIAGTVTFKTGLFSQFFPKPFSEASISFPTINVSYKWGTDLDPLAFSYQEANFDPGPVSNPRNRVLFYPYGSITAPTGNSGMLLSYKVSGNATDFTKNSSWQTADIAQILNKPSAVDFGGGFLDDQDNFAYLPPGQKTDASLSATAVTVKVDLAKQYANPNDPTAYQSIDLRNLPNIPSVGSFSGVFGNGYAYFTPTADSKTGKWHGILIRYDSTKTFSDPNSWQWFNINTITNPPDTSLGGMQSVAYIAPYVYLIPFLNGSSAPGGQLSMSSKIVRYDTTKDFQSPTSYQTLDLTTLPFPTNIQNQLKGFTGGVVVGSNLVLVPWGSRDLQQSESVALIFDTTKSLTDQTAWQYIDLTTVDPNAGGYQEGWIDKDGFVFFVPTHNYSSTVNRAPPLIAWNSALAFSDPHAWKSYGYLENIWSTGAAYDPNTNTAWLSSYGLNSTPQARMTQIQENPSTSATMSLVSTQTASINPIASFSAQIRVRTDVNAANLFTAKLTFPPNLLQVQGISTAGSFITNWVDTSYDNTLGTISIIGGLPNPGFQTSGSSAPFASISFRALGSPTGGVANISFDTSAGKSAVYSNSDNTNLLSSTTPLALTVNPQIGPQLFDCTAANVANCPDLLSSVDPPASGGFYGQADPSIRKDPLSNKLWMSYSWPETHIIGGGVTVPAVDIHLSSSVDGGKTWQYEGPLWPSTANTNKGGDNGPGFDAHEVSNLLPVNNNGVVTWYGVRWTYFVPQTGGYAAMPASSMRLEISQASTPTGLGLSSAPTAILGGSSTTSAWGTVDTNLSTLSPALVGQFNPIEPSLYYQYSTKTLYLTSQSGNAIVVFKTQPVGDIHSWTWQIVGVLTSTTDAQSLGIGAIGLTQGDLVLGPDGKLLLVATPLKNDPTLTSGYGAISAPFWDHFGCWAFEVSSIDPPALAKDSSGNLKVRAIVTASDLDPAGPGSCSYDPASSTGLLMARRHLQSNPVTTTIQKTGLQLTPIGTPISSPTPSPTASPNPTASPSSVPTASPTPTASPIPTASPTPSPTPVPVACSLTSGVWSNLPANPVTAGTTVSLTVNSTGDCAGKTISFAINQDNGILPASSVSNNPANATLVGNSLTTTWSAEYQPDGPFGIFDPPEYYFTASLTDGSSTVTSSQPELQVNNSSGVGGPSPSPTRVDNSGDGNNDGLVNLTDLSTLLSNFVKVSTQPDFPNTLDLNHDGIINSFDFSLEVNLLRSNGSI